MQEITRNIANVFSFYAIITIEHVFFNALTFTRSLWRCWKLRPSASVFNTSHGTWRMLMHEKPCLIPILYFFLQCRTIWCVFLQKRHAFSCHVMVHPCFMSKNAASIYQRFVENVPTCMFDLSGSIWIINRLSKMDWTLKAMNTFTKSERAEVSTLRKHAYSNILKILPPKKLKIFR